MFVERRFGKREAVKLTAPITSTNGDVINVVVTDYTHQGCRLVACGAMRLPKYFTLRVQGGTLPSMKAEIVWRQGDDIGVKFLLEAEPRTGKQEAASQDWPSVTYGG